MAPLVSIVIRTEGKRPALLDGAVRSVLGQTHPAMELVVVQDGGDDLKAPLDRLVAGGGCRFAFIGSAKVGRSRAGNLGLAAAGGDVLGFLDDDDLLLPGHAARLVAALAAAPQAGAAFGRAYAAPADWAGVRPPRQRWLGGEERFSLPLLWLGNYLPIQSVLFRRALLERHGGLDESLEALEDWDLWLRYSIDTPFIAVPEATSVYRVAKGAAARRARLAAHRPALTLIRQKHAGLSTSFSHGDLTLLLDQAGRRPERFFTGRALAAGLLRKVAARIAGSP